MLPLSQASEKGNDVDRATEEALEQVIGEKIEGNGGRVEEINLFERKQGQVFARVKLQGEDGERQAAFGVADLLEER